MVYKGAHMAIAQMSEKWRVGATEAPLPPKVAGLPILGVAHKMSTDPLRYFVDLYKQYGPIFRVNIFNRKIVVMAGLEANRFLNTDGNHVLNSQELFGSFGREFNNEIFLTAMDGEHHLHLRKVMRQGYSRSAMMPHVPELLQIIDEYTQTLKPGDTIKVFTVLQRLVTEQIGVIAAGKRPGDYFKYIQRFLNFSLNVHVLKMWPKFMLKLPIYREAKAKSLELGRMVLEAHRADSAEGGHRDLIDDLLSAKDPQGNPYNEDMLLSSTIGPYFAGMDTVAASLSFFVYNVLKHPEVKHASTEEADNLFSSDIPNLNQMKGMEMLHGASIETLRIHPATPFTPRNASETFEFAGHRVEAGSEVFVAQTVTHYLEEFYPNPETFDATRFAKGQGKGVQGVFAPYTLGSHMCLGASIADTLMLLIMARLLHNLDLELESPDYTVKISSTPLPNPGRDFTVRVRGQRH